MNKCLLDVLMHKNIDLDDLKGNSIRIQYVYKLPPGKKNVHEKHYKEKQSTAKRQGALSGHYTNVFVFQMSLQ